MSLINFVKKYCPDSLLPFAKTNYAYIRKFLYRYKIPQIITRADKLRPYYRDELSLLILSDQEKFLMTNDKNVFIERALKQGWKFHQIYSNISTYAVFDTEKYSGILVIYDEDNNNFHYVVNLLSICDWSEKYRVMKLDEFIKSSDIPGNELIFPIISKNNKKKFVSHVKQNKQHCEQNIYYGIIDSIREDLQYFDVFEPVDDEIIIDAGAFDGATTKQFLQWGKGKVKKIYSFEMDPINAARCMKNLSDVTDKVILIEKGTWDKDELQDVYISGTSSSGVSFAGNKRVSISLTTIDSVVKDDKVTFIKMDVEGVELKSLMGAKNTIMKNKPRLAICVYHKPEDIYEIPEYILSLVPEYRFYLRHYDSGPGETVLYASCD